MSRIQAYVQHNYIPHPMQLFVGGTNGEDGAPNLSVFCWVSFCWEEGALKLTMCLDGDKPSKRNIEREGRLSLCMLAAGHHELVDRLGRAHGADKDAAAGLFAVERGRTLDVPVLADSPLCYELEVERTVPLDGSSIFICAIADVTTTEGHVREDGALESLAAGALLASQTDYLALGPDGKLGPWC